MSKIDFSKPVQTRYGRAVVIFTTAGRGERCVVGQIENTPDCWFANSWFADGLHPVGSDLDLQNAPPKPEVFEGYMTIIRRDSGETTYSLFPQAWGKPRGTNYYAIKKVRIEYLKGDNDATRLSND